MAEDRLRTLVEAALTRVLSRDGPASPQPTPRFEPRPETVTKEVADDPTPRIRPEAEGLVTERDVLAARSAGVLYVQEGSIITPAARDTADRYRVRFEDDGGGGPDAASLRRVAIGGDHGGFKLKQALKAHLLGLGYNVEDEGTHSTDACDYPDIALRVAARVARGDCARGILVDGAGIGSAMTANKVPGVLAASCESTQTARNSREHNNANVLCIGSGVLSESAAFGIVTLWLETPFGGGRHARRVDKIRGVERMFLLRKGRMEGVSG